MPEEIAAPPGAGFSPETHRRLGAQFERTALGSQTPLHYGSAENELQVLRESAGVGDRSWLETVELRGEDRTRFLNGLVTCDVGGAAVGECVYGFFTDAKGKVLADAVVRVGDDQLELELAPGKAAEIAAHLKKYVIADRVEVEVPASRETVVVVGPQAGERLVELSGASGPREEWQAETMELLGRPARVVRHPRLGAEGFLVRAANEGASLFQALCESGLPPIGYGAMEVARVEAGVPIFGIDLDDDVLPQETGFEEAVSYSKGCYLGQEVIARIHYRGGVNRVLRGLRLGGVGAGDRASVRFENRQVGEATSALVSPTHGPIALGLLHRKAAEPGTEVEVEGVGLAHVIELPFERTGD